MSHYAFAISTKCPNCNDSSAFTLLPVNDFQTMVEEIADHLVCEECAHAHVEVSRIRMISNDKDEFEIPLYVPQLASTPNNLSNQEFFSNDCRDCKYSGTFCREHDDCGACPCFCYDCDGGGCACMKPADTSFSHCPYLSKNMSE